MTLAPVNNTDDGKGKRTSELQERAHSSENPTEINLFSSLV